MSLQRHSAPHKTSGTGLRAATQLCPNMEWDVLYYCISSSSDTLKNLQHLKPARTDNTYTWSGDTWSFSSISRAGGSTSATQDTLSRDPGLPLQSTICKLHNWTPLILLGPHSAFSEEGKVLGAVREGKAALHFCEGGGRSITFLCYPSIPQSALH